MGIPPGGGIPWPPAVSVRGKGIQSPALRADWLFPVPDLYESKLSTGPKPKTAGRKATD